jgi:L-alanine-DL-glutamate epimerase-like enolase superfamily enzyme
MSQQPFTVRSIAVHFLPVRTRLPLKFGTEITTSVTLARVSMTLESQSGQRATGWGETPLSVQWTWPSPAPYEMRHQAMKDFCLRLGRAWSAVGPSRHPMEMGSDFQQQALGGILKNFNLERGGEPMPWLCALVCLSAFDLALHDAFGRLHQRPVYELYSREWMTRDLSQFLEPAKDARVSFDGKYVSDFLTTTPSRSLPAWHLVGGLDLLEASELTGTEPQDGHPVLLRDWIRRDGLNCLKIKLRGTDEAWDYDRLAKVGQIAVQEGVQHLTADFNCTVREPAYVNRILDRFAGEHPRLSSMILYVEQPFPYELEEDNIDVRSVSSRQPLFLDESAHDWKMVRLGRELGWTGVALKTCKTQTGALLSACWAKAHGMSLMVQDLTNPMLAQIPHVLLAAHVGTIMGVETNAMQFYPEASAPEAAVHPGLYQRRNGSVDLSTLSGPGFGYRLEEMQRELPKPDGVFER